MHKDSLKKNSIINECVITHNENKKALLNDDLTAFYLNPIEVFQDERIKISELEASDLAAPSLDFKIGETSKNVSFKTMKKCRSKKVGKKSKINVARWGKKEDRFVFKELRWV